MNTPDDHFDTDSETEEIEIEDGGSSERSLGVPTALALGATLAVGAAACATDDADDTADPSLDDPTTSTSTAPPTPDPYQLFSSSDAVESDRSDAVVDERVLAEVQVETLDQAAVLTGSVGPQSLRSVAPPVSAGDPDAVTAAPAAVGETVRSGQVVVAVDERPVIALEGTPNALTRSLVPGAQGDDVVALQRALERLGQTIDADEVGTYGASTQQAVTAVYVANGYTPGPSPVSAADLAVARDTVVAAELAHLEAEQLLEADRAARPGEPEIIAVEAQVDVAERNVADERAATRHEVDEQQWRVDVAIAERDRIAADPNSTQADVDAANLRILDERNLLDAVKRDARDRVALAEDQLDVALAACKEVIEAAAPDPALLAAVEATEIALAEAATSLVVLEAADGPTVPLGEFVLIDEPTAIVVPPRSADAVVGLTTDEIVVQAEVPAGVDVDVDEPAVVLVGGQEVDGVVIDGATAAPDDDQALIRLSDGARSIVGAEAEIVLPETEVESVELVVPGAAVERAPGGEATVLLADGDEVEQVAVDVIDEVGGWLAVEPEVDGELELGDDVVVR